MVHDQTLLKHYVCLVNLCNWMAILLQRALTSEDIDLAEEKCRAWRKEIVELSSTADCDYPNFHNVLHMFNNIRRWGPPVLWWTRPFGKLHYLFN
jgi:hypothetical protein